MNDIVNILFKSSVIIAAVIYLVKTVGPHLLSYLWNRASDKYKHKLNISKETHSKYFTLALDYFSDEYRYYRLCQQLVNYDVITYPDGSSKTTRDIFKEKSQTIIERQRDREGLVKLLFPESIRTECDELTINYNDFIEEFKRLAQGDSKDELISIFDKIDVSTKRLEILIRDYFRTESLLE